MALSASTVWEVQNGGSDTNGGGFVTGSGGVDYSQQTSPVLALTDAVGNGSTTVTSTVGGFTSQMVGSIAYIQGAWYEIKTRSDTNTITVDRATGTFTGGTCNVGGAFATIQTALDRCIAGNLVFVKYNATPFSISTSLSLPAVGAATSYCRLIGYNTSRASNQSDCWADWTKARPIIKTTAAVNAIGGTNAGYWLLENLELDGNSVGLEGIEAPTSYLVVTRLLIHHFTQDAINNYPNTQTLVSFCEAHHCVGYNYPSGVITGTAVLFCYVHDCPTGSGYGIFSDTTIGNIVYNCPVGIGMYNLSVCIGNTVIGNTYDGLQNQSYASYACIANNLIANNGRYGVLLTSNGTKISVMRNNAFYNNSSGHWYNATQLSYADIVLNSSPFTNYAGGDFTLNDAADGGLLCRAAAIGAPNLTSYEDVGALQHQDVATYIARMRLNLR